MRSIGLLCASIALLGVEPARAASSFLGGFHAIKTVASTVPHNGDVNPYGVAVSPVTKGRLVQGHVLVSNFNNKANNQGTGTTIVQIGPGGDVDLFAEIDAKQLPGRLPRRRGTDDGAGGVALGLGHRGQFADGQRAVVDSEGRMFDRAERPGKARQDLLGRFH